MGTSDALGARRHRLYAITTQRKHGGIGSVCIRSIRLTPEPARWKRAYPGFYFPSTENASSALPGIPMMTP
jgi:hypothetical protein